MEVSMQWKNAEGHQLGAITPSHVASGRPQPENLLIWAVPFPKREDEVGRTQRQPKPVTRGLVNLAYREPAAALG